MKRTLLLLCLMTAVLLTGCGAQTEVLRQPEPVSYVEQPEPNETATTEPVPQTEPVPDEPTATPDFDAVTDEQAIGRLYSELSNDGYIQDYAMHEDFYNLFVPPETGDPVQALQASEPNCAMEQAGETELYSLWNFPELDAAPYLLPKNFREAGNDYAYYDGELDKESVLANFDILANDKKLLTRWYRDDPEIKCVIYEFFAVEDKGDGTAELGWYCYPIDRENHMVRLTPEWNRMRTIQLPDASVKLPDVVYPDVVYDIELTLEKREILIGRDDPQLVIRAVPEPECKPVSIQLINADTGELVCDLVDDCDYEAHGDNIQGDGWYCNRWTAPTDFGTDPDVSEELTLHFYAQFERDGVLHRSETVELTMIEPWTDKELDDRQKVDDAINELMQTDAWKQANTETRGSLAKASLRLLAEKGLVDPDSIGSTDDMVSWSYTSGGTSCIQLKPFDPRMN